MLKIETYSLKGTKLDKTVTIPDVKENLALLSQAMHVYRDRAHTGSSKTKTRGEINRTTKKVYKQKGTGGARHGSRRAPIYVGGGTAHGKKLEQKILSLPQKMKRKALDVAMFLKAKNKEMFVVVGLGTVKKTKEAQNLLNKLVLKGKKVIVLANTNAKGVKSLTNLRDTEVILMSNLNAYQIIIGGKLIMDADVFTKAEVVKSAKVAKVVAKKTEVKKSAGKTKAEAKRKVAKKGTSKK